MSFNEGFSTQGIPFITGSVDGQALGWSSTEQTWVATGSVAGNTGASTTKTDGTTILGDGSDADKIRLNPNVTASNLLVTGDLTVRGSTTTIDTNNLVVKDKLIEIGSGSLNNSQASGSGIAIKAGSNADKTILWNNDGTGFNFSDGIKTNNAITASVFTGSSLIVGSGVANINSSVANGIDVNASGIASHAEGNNTTASAYYSHAEGLRTKATQLGSHAEGNLTLASGYTAHSEGYLATASGDYSHAEGQETKAISPRSHAEGYYSQTNGDYSHAEGLSTQTFGAASHAEGKDTQAIGNYSHAEGIGTVAEIEGQHVAGKYNQSNLSAISIIGNGDIFNRSNILEVYTNSVVISGALNAYNVTASLFTGSFKGDGSQLTSVTASFLPDIQPALQIYVSSVSGSDDNVSGSFNKPFQTLSKAVTYLSSSVNHLTGAVINLSPGIYGGVTLDRRNTIIRGVSTKNEQRAVTITGSMEVSCSVNAGRVNVDVVGFDGIFFDQTSGKPTFKVSTNSYTTYLNNCYIYGEASQNAVQLTSTLTTGSSGARVVIKDSYLYKATGNADVLSIGGGQVKLDTCEITFGGSGVGVGVRQTGISTVTADRVLIDVNSTNCALSGNVNSGSIYPGIYVSNSSIVNRGSTDAISIGSPGHLYITNTILGQATANPLVPVNVNGASGGTITYGSLTSLSTFGITINSSLTQNKLSERFGDVVVGALSSSTHISASYFTGSTANFSTLTGSLITGSRGIIATITGSTFTGSLVTVTNITGTNIAANYASASVITVSDLNVDYVDFDLNKWDPTATPVRSPGAQLGRIFYNSGSGDLSTFIESNGLYLNNGQQLIQKVRNTQGSSITKGQIVHISGAVGSGPNIGVKLANWDNDGYSANTLGLVLSNTITDNNDGYIIVAGLLENVDTSGGPGNPWNSGDILYLSGSGLYTTTKPVAPKHSVSIGQIIRRHGSLGSIYVKIQNGYELEELHDVSASNAVDGDLLVRNGTLSPPIWVSSKSLTGSYGISGNLTASTGFRTPEGVQSYITASKAISSSFADTAGAFIGSSNYARRDEANTFASGNIFNGTSNFNAPLTASSGILFESGFIVKAGITASFLGDIQVNGTASIAHLQTISQSSLNVGDKYIVILSASADHTDLDQGGLYWGSGNIGGVSVDSLGAHAHVNFNSLENRLEIFPGLFVSGTLSGSDTKLNSLTSSYYTGSNAAITVVTASQFTGSEAIINKITASSYTGSLANIGTVTSSYFTGSYAIINQVTASEYTGSRATITEITASAYTGSIATINTITASYFTGSYAIINQVTASEYTGSRATIADVTASNYTGSLAIINTVTASYFTGSYAIVNEITASNYTGSIATITTITASEISASRETVDIFTASFISAGNISASSGITGSFSGSGALINGLTGSNWSGGTGSFYADIRSAFSGSGAITINAIDGGRYEISSSGGSGGISEVFTRSPLSGSGSSLATAITIDPTQPITASAFSASTYYYGDGSQLLNILSSGQISSSFARMGSASVSFIGTVSASTSKLNEIVLTTVTTDFDISLLKTGSLMAISGTNLTTASFLDERKANFIGILTNKVGNTYTIATSGIVSGSNAGGSLFQGGQIVYVSSSGLCGTYDGISTNGYITQVGIASFDVQSSGSIILQPRIFGVKG